MKATILGTDLLQHGDSVKILEINTNATIFNSAVDNLNFDALFNVVTANNITEFHFIYSELNTTHPQRGTEGYSFADKIEQKCNELGITYTPHIVPDNSVTVPHIEDTDNKFILRQAYDTSALVDSTYCADKFEFFSLMSSSSYIPKTYFTSDDLTLDTLDSLNISDSHFPNLVEKARYPLYDRLVLPKLSKHTTQDGLTSSKSSLLETNLLQEFIDDESNIVNGYWSIIRSIDIIYGSNLDTINLGGYTHSALVSLSFADNEFEENGIDFNKKTRIKYINKNVRTDVATIAYHTDEESDILMFDGTVSNVSTIAEGDTIKTIMFDYLTGSHELPSEATTTVAEISSSLTFHSASLISKESLELSDLFIKISLDNGEVWNDTPGTGYIIEESGSLETRFEFVNKLIVGDNIITINKNTSDVSKREVTGLEITFSEQTIYNLDFEDIDYFMVDVNNDEYSIMHNICTGCGWASCGNYWCDSFCYQCSGPPGLKQY